MRKYPRQNLDDLDIDLKLPEELDEESIAKLYQKWSLDPLAWCHYFFPNYFRKQSPPFHYEIARNWLYSPYKIEAYEAPRGFAKTTLGEFLTFHSIVFGGILFIIFISQTEDVASQRLLTIQHEAQYNKVFRLFFGDLVSEKWGEKELILKNEKGHIHTKLLARGLGQQILGAKYLEQRPGLIVIDDPEDMKIAENPANVDKDERWLLKEVIPALDEETGKAKIISTPVTSDCLIERMKGRRNVHFQRFSAITDLGAPLWPEHMDGKKLAEKQLELSESGYLYVYFTEYLCNPLSPDRHPITEDMFQYYNEKDIALGKGGYNIFIICDLAIGEKKRNAFSALVVIAVDEQDTWRILDTYQTRSDWTEFARDVYAFRDKWNPIAVGVEASATQKGFWDVLRLVGEKYGHKQIYPIPLYPDKDKDIRLRRLLPRFRMNKVLFKREQMELKKQLILHPDYKFMDLKDCLSYGEVFCYPPGANRPKELQIESWRMKRAATDEELDQECKEMQKGLRDMDDDWN